MADKATETLSSKFISSTGENASDHVKMISSRDEESKSTLDAYELEFERVMYEQEKQEMCRKYAQTVTLNCDSIPIGHKPSASTVTIEECFTHTDCAPSELNPTSQKTIHRKTQVTNSSEPPNNKSILAGTSGEDTEEFFPHVDRAPCELNQTSQKAIHNPSQGKNCTETCRNKAGVSAETSKSESFINIDCAPCELSQISQKDIHTSTQSKSNSGSSRNKRRVLATTCANTPFIKMNWNKCPTQTTTQTHTTRYTQRLGASGLSRNEKNQDDYPPELNPFSDDNGTERKQSTNPFGDSDNEEDVDVETPPKPRPRPRTNTNTLMTLEQRCNRLPVPLPRTPSKSVPTTPHQSPLLLHHNRSFRLPSPANSSTYNSIRRKKKPAPPPPCHPLSDTTIASPTTKGRPRKARPAPPPPPDQTKTSLPSKPNKTV